MPTFRSQIALASLSMCVCVAWAQPAAAPTGSDVKADTRAAVKAGTTAEGETQKDTAASSPQGMSGKSRAQVKSEAKAAVATGETAKSDTDYRDSRGPASSPAKSRATVRSDAKGR